MVGWLLLDKQEEGGDRRVREAAGGSRWPACSLLPRLLVHSLDRRFSLFVMQSNKLFCFAGHCARLAVLFLRRVMVTVVDIGSVDIRGWLCGDWLSKKHSLPLSRNARVRHTKEMKLWHHIELHSWVVSAHASNTLYQRSMSHFGHISCNDNEW